MNPYRFLPLADEAGHRIRGSGREIVAAFLASPAFSTDGARADWLRKAIWCALFREAASVAGYVVRQAQEQRLSWLSAEEEGFYLDAVRAGFGRPGRWTLAASQAQHVSVEGFRDCTPRAAAAESDHGAGGAGDPLLSNP